MILLVFTLLLFIIPQATEFFIFLQLILSIAYLSSLLLLLLFLLLQLLFKTVFLLRLYNN
jgi:hypothetical protein